MTTKVKELNRENFAVRQHLKYVDIYANESNYVGLTYEDTLVVREELAPLIEPENDEVTALRFDALMYGIELAYLLSLIHILTVIICMQKKQPCLACHTRVFLLEK